MMNRTRAAGWSAVAFAASVITINVVENVGTGRPDPTASATEVASWAVDANAYLWATTVLVPIAWVCLTVFASAVWTNARSRGLDGGYPLMGVMGTAMTMGTLSAAVAADAVLISSSEHFGIDVVEALSRFTTVLFLFNWAALAVALFGFSRTTVELGWTPRWLGGLCTIGAAALLIGSVQSGLILDDILPGILIGLAGFAIWLLFLAVTGLRLVRLAVEHDGLPRSDSPALLA